MHDIISTFVLLLVVRLAVAWLPSLIRGCRSDQPTGIRPVPSGADIGLICRRTGANALRPMKSDIVAAQSTACIQRWPNQQNRLLMGLMFCLAALALLSPPFSNRGLADDSEPTAVHDSAIPSTPPNPPRPPEPVVREFRDAVLLYISERDFRKLLVQDERLGLVGLDQLQRGFTLIPLPATGPVGLPAAMRRVLRPAGVQILQNAIGQILELTPPDASSDDVADLSAAQEQEHSAAEAEQLRVTAGGFDAAEAAELSENSVADDSQLSLAEWVESPDVVKSEFLEATVSAEEALREPVLKKLEERIDQLVRQQWGTDVAWRNLVDVIVPDQVVRRCIVRSDARTEVIETSEGSHPMRQTYALLDIPASLETQIMEHVQQGIQRNRMITLCLMLGGLWLAIIAFSAACRATQGSSLLRKLATFPVMAALMIPCLLTSVLLLDAMISGRLLPIPQPALQVVCAEEAR